MKTAGRKKPNRWANASSNRAHGAAVQHRSCSVKWAAKQENVQPLEMCFLLTSPFIELIRSYLQLDGISHREKIRSAPRYSIIAPYSALRPGRPCIGRRACPRRARRRACCKLAGRFAEAYPARTSRV